MGKVDRRLFDVTLLIEFDYDDAHRDSLPLIVTRAPSTRQLAASARAMSGATLKEQKALREKLDAQLPTLRLERVLNEPPPENLDGAIARLEADIQKAAQMAPIMALPRFAPIQPLPDLPLSSVKDLLGVTIQRVEEQAQRRVLEQFDSLGNGGPEWVRQGLVLQTRKVNARCPFCDQDLRDGEGLVA